MSFLDPTTILTATGYLGLFLAVFAETGLLIGVMLPGDSLLFVAGFLASTNYLNIVWIIVLSFIASVIGDSTGYMIGRKYGPAVFAREESFFFKKSYVERARVFYEKHGAKTIVLARFMPIVRTFAPLFAGIGGMKYSLFFFYNVVGGALWTLSMCLFGYFLGKTVPNADAYVLPIVIGLIIVSMLPGVIKLIMSRNK
jgi:membrane-associated protein